MDLGSLGWNDFFVGHYKPYSEQGYGIGRVAAEHKHIYRVYTEQGDLLASVSGKMRYDAKGRQDFPAVGDWVVISVLDDNKATIHAVLPRQSKFSRKAAGNTTEEQIVAANINTVFLVNALNNDFNLRRIERYLTLAWESGASPVIILSKADLGKDIEQKVIEVESIAFGVPIHVISSVNGEGLTDITRYLTPGNTVALLGSSGAGKSTLINRIIGKDIQKTQDIRQGDHKGRHTTTYRELIPLSQGANVIDTPGMRELQLWGTDEGVRDTFEDIESLAKQCRFADCQHQSEPHCAVKRAIEEGSLDYARYESYLKLQKELAYLADQQEYLAQKEKLVRSYTLFRRQKNRR